MARVKQVVVTRHAGTIEYLRREGYIAESAVLLAHAEARDVAGAHVVGMLPYYLAALADSVTVVDMDIPQEMRGVDLSTDQVAQYATAVSTYVVTKVSTPRPRYSTNAKFKTVRGGGEHE